MCMGFLWVTGFSFFHCVASPFHSFVTTTKCVLSSYVTDLSHLEWKDDHAREMCMGRG